MDKEGFFLYVNNLNSFNESVKPKGGPGCMVNKGFLTIVFLLLCTFLQGADFYETGLNDFREGRTDQAVLNLEKALQNDPVNDSACLYLGILYQNKGDLSRAESYYSRGRDIRGSQYENLTFNLANLYFNGKRYDQASSLYEILLQSPGEQRTASLLNLANLSVATASYDAAIDLYLDYLMEDPETNQRENIEKMISLLRKTLDEREARKLAEEQRIQQERELAEQKELEEKQRLEEEARQKLLAEQKRLEEEAKQKALLEDILNSLSNSGKETRSITAESEQLKEEFEESGLDD
jgi:tetratricopeptide (TPR) repeat protein